MKQCSACTLKVYKKKKKKTINFCFVYLFCKLIPWLSRKLLLKEDTTCQVRVDRIGFVSHTSRRIFASSPRFPRVLYKKSDDEAGGVEARGRGRGREGERDRKERGGEKYIRTCRVLLESD